MTNEAVRFHRYSQDLALSSLLPILEAYLPYSGPIHSRIQAPHNTPSRHCLFASTFEPGQVPEHGNPHTIIFSDRSRYLETQIWVFNPLITKTSLTSEDQLVLKSHLTSMLLFLKQVQIPEAPGWPFQSILKFGCLHEFITDSLSDICRPLEAMPYISVWNLWNISLPTVIAKASARRQLREGFTVQRVPEDQINLVISTSSIPRQASTLLLQPNVGLLNQNGEMLAWGYLGTDGSFSTLYVMPEYRGRGLATYVAMELLSRLGRGEFKELGYDGGIGWAHSDVHDGNQGSEGVMRALGARIGWKCSYLWIDSSRFLDP